MIRCTLPCNTAILVALFLAPHVAADTLPVTGGLVAHFQANEQTVAFDSATGAVASWTAANDASLVLNAAGTTPTGSDANISYSPADMAGSPAVVVNDFGNASGAFDNRYLIGDIGLGGGPLTDATIFWLGYYAPGRDGTTTGFGQYAYSLGEDGGAGSQMDHQREFNTGAFELFGGSGTQAGADISALDNQYTVWRTEYFAEGGPNAPPGHMAFANGVDLAVPADSTGYSVPDVGDSDDLVLFGYQNSSGTSGGFNFVGNMSELIIYDRILTPGEVAAVESYLTARAIPEPAGFALVGLAAICATGRVRRR